MYLTLTPETGPKPYVLPQEGEVEGIMPGQKGFVEAAMKVVSSHTFNWTDAEQTKFVQLSKQLNCPLPTLRLAIVYFLIHVSENRREIAVASIPEILAGFPIKWGYKKKRHDFLKTLQDMEFLYVQVNYWAKIRAKKYGVAKAGLNIMSRIVRILARQQSEEKK